MKKHTPRNRPNQKIKARHPRRRIRKSVVLTPQAHALLDHFWKGTK